MKRTSWRLILLSTCVISLLFVSQCVSAETRKGYITDFLTNCKVNTGGYPSITVPQQVGNAPQSGTSDIISTSQAIETLLAFGNASKDFSSDITWVLSLKVSDGGFKTSAANALETMISAYYACELLNSTGNVASASNTPSWILTLLNSTTGGFADQPGIIPTTIATCFAIQSLYYLMNWSSIVANATSFVTFINSCNNSDGGYGLVTGGASSLAGTWAAITALTTIAKLTGQSISTLFSSDKVLAYVNSSYYADVNDSFNYGGYGTDGRATLIESYYAMAIYVTLNVANPYKEEVQNYIYSCQNPYDGGFADKNTDSSSALTSSVTMTYYAFQTLYNIDNSTGNLNGEVWNLPFAWWWVVVIIAIIALVIVAAAWVYKKRQED